MTPADDVHVKVEHALCAVLPVVDDNAKADGAVLAAKLPSRRHEVSKDGCVFRRGSAESFNLFLGNDEEVNGRLRVDVTEREAHFVLVPSDQDRERVQRM